MTRTPDLLITNQLLYRLSYTSMESGPCRGGSEQVKLYHRPPAFVNLYFSRRPGKTPVLRRERARAG